ncbi:hypothetical protein [Shewanella sp.]
MDNVLVASAMADEQNLDNVNGGLSVLLCDNYRGGIIKQLVDKC